ncbi:MAG TPA: hypothetical protein VF184_08420 [Phycisphaeraceae bacterium]
MKVTRVCQAVICAAAAGVCGPVAGAADQTRPQAAVPYEVFAVGVYDAIDAEDLPRLRAMGFNCVEVFYDQLTPAYLDQAQRLGLKVIPFLFPGDAAKTADADAVAALELERYLDSPAISAWYPIDEPSGGRVPVATCLETYRLIKAKDPTRPVLTVLNKPQETADFYHTYDILGLDPYPVIYAGEWGGRLSLVADEMAIARKHDPHRPLWMALQAFGGIGGWARHPTGAELEAMAGMSLVHRAAGILYYTWRDPHENTAESWQTMQNSPDLIDAATRFNKLLATISDALAAPVLDQTVRVDPAHVRLLVDEHNRAYLIIVHGDYGRRDVTVAADLFRNATLVDGSDALSLTDGRLVARFDDCGVLLAQLDLAAPPTGAAQLAVSSDPPLEPLVPLNEIADISAPQLTADSYGIRNAGDGSLSTNWASPRPYTLPLAVEVRFRQPRAVRRVTIHPMVIDSIGYDAWQAIRLTASSGQVIEQTFEAGEMPYVFNLDGSSIQSMRIEILSTHTTRNYVGIREIDVQ